MSLLQHPVRALEQVEWYLQNPSLEKFPGAMLLAAGNLARQVLEQVLFIIAFYSGMPRNRFLKPNGELRSVDTIIKRLGSVDPATGLSFFELGRRRGPRIAKFIRHRRSFDRWRQLTNEPSHFAHPSAGRRVRDRHIHDFVRRLRATFEEVDGYLVIAAMNEIRSRGAVKATLAPGPDNIPGVLVTVVLTPRHLVYENGQLGFKGPSSNVRVVPHDREVPYRWGKQVVVIQHSFGMSFATSFVTRSGNPVDFSSSSSLIGTFARDPMEHPALIRRLRALGFIVRKVATPNGFRIVVERNDV